MLYYTNYINTGLLLEFNEFKTSLTKKKNTEHTRMYIFFLDFLHHYSQRRSAVRSTAKNNNKQKKKIE